MMALPAVVLAVLGLVGPQPQPAPALAGTEWVLVSMTGHEPATIAGLKRKVTATFREGKVAGSLGCNGFGGAYAIEGDRLVFGALVGTMMACPEPVMSIENTIRKALVDPVPFKLEDTRLTLTTASGVTLVFEAKPKPSRPSPAGPK